MLKGSSQGILYTGASHAPDAHNRFTDCLIRPAGTQQLDTGIGIGVPSYLPSSPASGRGLYFVSVRGADTGSGATAASAASFGSCAAARAPPPFEGLEVGALLGRGGYGSVYRGTYQGQPCAVKVCLQACDGACCCLIWHG